MAEHGLGIEPEGSALHRQHRVGVGGDDSLVGDRLVALVARDRIGGARQRHHAVGGGGPTRDHRPAVHEGEKKERTARMFDMPAQLGKRREVLLHGSRQALAARHRAGRPRDQPDLFDDAFAGEAVGDLDERHRCGFEHGDRFPRARALGRQHERGTEREHALGRQLAHVSDVRFLGERARRVEAGGVDGDHPLLEAERVEDLGDGAAHRDDAARVGDRHIAASRITDCDGRATNRCCSEHTQCRDSECERPRMGSISPHRRSFHFVRMSLFWAVRRRR